MESVVAGLLRPVVENRYALPVQSEHFGCTSALGRVARSVIVDHYCLAEV